MWFTDNPRVQVFACDTATQYRTVNQTVNQKIREGKFDAVTPERCHVVLDHPEPPGGRPGDRFDPLMALPVSILSTWERREGGQTRQDGAERRRPFSNLQRAKCACE